MRRFLVAACALTVGMATAPQPASPQGLMVTGYADLEVNFAGVDSDASEFFFDNHHFNIIAVGRLVENLFAAVEIEFEHAGEEIALEYGYISYTGFRNVRINAGKFIVPFGRFNKDLHPTWINKMPDRPHGFRDVLPQTYNDVGLWVTGGAPVGTAGTRITYDAFVVNGLLGEEGGGIRGMRDNDRESLTAGGRDNNKVVGGRLGLVLPPQGFDIGASIYTGNYFDNPDTNLTLTLYGVDAAYRFHGLELRAEIVAASQALSAGDNLTKAGGYVHAAYLIASRFEPIVRYSQRDMPGESADQNRLSFGASFYVSANAAIRLAYHKNGEKTGFESENDQVIAQFTVTF